MKDLSRRAILGLIVGTLAIVNAETRAGEVTQSLGTFGFGQLYACASAPDGNHIATAGGGGAFVWNVSTGQVVRSFTGHTGPVNAIAFSPDGSLILTGSSDKTAKLWNVTTGSLVCTFSGHTDAVRGVAFSANGTHVATASADKTAKLWNAATGALVRTFSGPTGGMNCVALSPDGSLIVAGSDDYKAWMWNAGTGASLHQFPSASSDIIYSTAFSPDGSLVLVGDGDGDFRLWNAATGLHVRTVTAHWSACQTAAFSSDGSRILTSGVDYDSGAELKRSVTAKLWNTDTGELVSTYVVSASNASNTNSCGAALSADDSRLLAASFQNVVRMWDTATGDELQSFAGHCGWIYSVACSPDGTRILCGGTDRTSLWDTATGALLRDFPSATAVAFSLDGSLMLTGATTATMWDAASGAEIRTFSGDSYTQFNSVAFSPDGTHVLAACSDYNPSMQSRFGRARLWDADTGTLIYSYDGANGGASPEDSAFYSAAFSPDGTTILTGGGEFYDDGLSGYMIGTLDLRNAGAGAVIRPFEDSSRSIMGVAFSPDGSSVLTGDYSGLTVLRDTATGTIKRTFGDSMNPVRSVAFSPCGSRMLAGFDEGQARLWNANNGTLVRTFTGHALRIWSVAYSPDGTRVFTGSEDGTVKMWSAEPLPLHLAVTSSPAGVAIPGSGGYEPGTVATLTAPASGTINGCPVAFRTWVINGVMASGNPVSVTMNAPASAEARYTFPNDTNGDNGVDILDLINIRNRLGQSVATGDNWLADVNCDGRINVLDLIAARNSLGTRCP